MSVAWMPVFPAMVCDECHAYLIWKKMEFDPDEKAHLECSSCRKVWQDNANYTLADQKEAVSRIMNEIQDLTRIALERVSLEGDK